MTENALSTNENLIVGAFSDKPIRKNLWLSAITTFAGFVSGTAIIMALGRLLSVPVFGEVVYAYTFGSLALLIPSYGFDLLVVREISQQRLSPSRALVNILGAKILLSILTLVGLALYIDLIGMPSSQRFVAWLFIVSGILNSFSAFVSAVNKGLNDFAVETKVAVVKSLLLCAFCLCVFVVFPRTALTVGVGMLLSNILGLGVAIYLALHSINMTPGLWPEWQVVWNLLKDGLPFAIQLIFSTLYFQIDTLIIGGLLDIESVGYYQASTRLVIATIPIAMLVINTFYPRLARDYAQRKQDLWSSDAIKMMWMLVTFGVLGTGSLIVLASPIIVAVYGVKMLPSVPVLRVFSLVLLLRFVAGGCGILLVAVCRQQVLVWAAVVASIVNVILNLTLVPLQGVIASAWVNVITNLLILFVYVGALSGSFFKMRPRLEEAK